MTASLFDRAGGEPALRTILRDFYDRVFADPMIGFFFRDAQKERLIEKEYELVAEHLGAPGVRYTGRPLREAHESRKIMGGQFDRRLQILRETLADRCVPDPVTRAWIAHTQALRPEITPDVAGECRPAEHG